MPEQTQQTKIIDTGSSRIIVDGIRDVRDEATSFSLGLLIEAMVDRREREMAENLRLVCDA